MKQINIKFLLVLLISMLGVKASAHDIAVKNADGKYIFYKFINNTELAVSYRGSYSSSYLNEYSGNVVIPKSVTYNGTSYPVTSIGYEAFEGCSDLTSISIPNSVTSIGERAFRECSVLTSVTIPNSVTSIGESAFADCSGLTSIAIGNSVTSIGRSAFSRCTGLTSVTIPNSVTSIGESAFESCGGLTSITIPNSVTNIGGGAFNGTVWYGNQSDGLVYAGKIAYNYKGTMPSNTNIVLEEGTIGIASWAFYGCSDLTSITIPNSMTSIGICAFRGCSGLTSIIIPNSVTNIGDYTFQNCSSLMSIIIGNSVTNIGSSAFQYCSGLTSITIPNSVTSIGSGAFDGCSGLTSITIPNTVTNIGGSAFNNTDWYNSQPDGLVYAGKVAYKYKSAMPSNTNIILKEGTLGIAGQAFSNCSVLTSVTIPNSVTNIGNYAFSGCSGLTSITIPNSMTSIESGAFEGCSGLTSVTIPNSVTSIGGGAFYGCSGLTGVTIPNSVTSIDGSAFEDCTALSSITIPNSVTSIGEWAFSSCSGLTSISIGNSVASIGYDAFSNCPKLTDVYCYAEKVPTTEPNAFENSNIEYATLHVTKAAMEDYKTTVPWGSFKKFVSNESQELFYKMNISVSNAYGKVTYGTTEITDGQQTFDVKEGSDVVLTLTPNDGYRVATVTVNGEDKTAEVVDGQLTINNVTANVVVNVSFITAGETASVSIGSAGMATLCSAKDLDFTEVSGLKAYTGAGFNRTTGALTMLEVKDAPAGTGLVLIGSEGTYDIPVKPSASVYGNLLVGVTEDTQLAQTANGYTNYILGNGDHGLGFYIVTAEGGTLAAGKAYLRLPTVTANARRVISIEYGEGVTAVDDQRMMPAESDGSYYILNGQRMTETPSKAGVYIKDGHKVIIK